MGTCADKPKLQGDYEVTKKSGLRKSTKNSSKSDDIPYDQGSQENHQHRSQAGPQSEEDLKKSIFQLFDKYDTNHDGFLDKNEAENMLDDMFKRTRDQKHQITKNHVLQFFRVADLSQDEKISKEQLYRFYKIQH